MGTVMRVLAVVVLLLIAGFVIAFVRTGNRQHLRHAYTVTKVGIALALVFFAGLFIERLLS